MKSVLLNAFTETLKIQICYMYKIIQLTDKCAGKKTSNLQPPYQIRQNKLSYFYYLSFTFNVCTQRLGELSKTSLIWAGAVHES